MSLDNPTHIDVHKRYRVFHFVDAGDVLQRRFPKLDVFNVESLEKLKKEMAKLPSPSFISAYPNATKKTYGSWSMVIFDEPDFTFPIDKWKREWMQKFKKSVKGIF